MAACGFHVNASVVKVHGDVQHKDIFLLELPFLKIIYLLDGVIELHFIILKNPDTIHFILSHGFIILYQPTLLIFKLLLPVLLV